MLINTDLATDTSSLARAQNRTQASPAAAAPQNSPVSSPSDSSLQSLTSTPVDVQDADWAIQDEAGADKATSFASLNILNQSKTAMTAQANQLSQNVLSLLQPTD